MLTKQSYFRIAVLALILPIIGFLAYPYITEKMVAGGYSNLVQFYFLKMTETFRDLSLDKAMIQYGITIAFLGLGIEILILGWRRSSLRRLIKFEDKSSVNDIFYWLVATLQLNGIIRFILTLGGASAVSFLIGKLNLDLGLIHRIEMPFLQYLMAFLVMDFMGYFQHRLAHSLDWWWELHKIHHSAEEFNMITFYRTHVLESIPRAIIYGLAISIVGSWHSFIFYYAVLELISMLVHSEVQYKWGWLEKYILVSPRNHKIHHSIHPDHHNKNFGFTLIIWDRIFGTWHEPKDDEPVKIGLKNNPFNHTNPLSDLWLAYKNSLMALLKMRQDPELPDVRTFDKPTQ